MKITTLITILVAAVLLCAGIVLLINGLFPPGTAPELPENEGGTTETTTQNATEATTESTTEATTQPITDPTEETTVPPTEEATIPVVIVPGNRPTEPTEATEPSQEETEPSQEETEPTQKETSGNDWNVNFGDLIGKK